MISVIVLIVFCTPLSSIAVNSQEIQSPSPSDAVRFWIEPYSFASRHYSCRWGDMLYGDVMVESDDTIDLYICDLENYELWSNSEAALFVLSIENINNCTWLIDVPTNSTWVLLYRNNGPEEIRVFSSFQCTTRVKLTIVPAIYVSQVCIGLGILGIFLNRAFRKKAVKSTLDSGQLSIESKFTLEILDKIGSGILLTQALIMVIMSILMIQPLYPPDNGVEALGIVAVILVFIPMAMIPYLCAVSISSNRNFHYPLLMLWTPLALFFGNIFTGTWIVTPNNDNLVVGLTFLVPIWLTLAYIVIRYDKRKTSYSIENQ